jgi:Rrf2 family iron-sulfur cluster assembly transcriptional regulator
MLSLSHTAGYAVVALSCLDEPGQLWTLAKDIARCTGLPGAYLSQILCALGRAGLVETKRGYRGGFRLSRSSQEISVLEVVEAIEGPRCFETCLLGLDVFSDKRGCPTYEFWEGEKARIRAHLGKLSLAKVARFERIRQGCSQPGKADACISDRPNRLRRRSPGTASRLPLSKAWESTRNGNATKPCGCDGQPHRTRKRHANPPKNVLQENPT